MKYTFGNFASLKLLSQLPDSGSSWQAAPRQISTLIAEQTISNSFFISILFLQICLFALIFVLLQKLARRRTRFNSLPPPGEIYESQRLSGQSLYEHLILDKSSAYIQSSNFYYQAQNLPSPNHSREKTPQPEFQPNPQQDLQQTQQPGSQQNLQPGSQHTIQPGSRHTPEHGSDYTPPGIQHDLQHSPQNIITPPASQKAGQLQLEERNSSYEANHSSELIDASPLLEFSVTELFSRRIDADKMTFNAAYFACDKICDALYAKDVNGAMLLIKRYGAMPAVMSLVERKLKRASINCHWRLYTHTGVGELVLKNDKFTLCFRSATDEFVEAIVGRHPVNGSREGNPEFIPGLTQTASIAR